MKVVLDTNRHEKAGQTGQVFSLFRPSRRIMDFSLPRPFAPGSESSRWGTFAPWNFRYLELSLPPNKCRPSKASSKASSDSFANFCIDYVS